MKWCRALMLGVSILIGGWTLGYADDELLIFAVVSEVPKDKSRVPVKASVNDVAMDTKLLASDAILNNLVWKNWKSVMRCVSRASKRLTATEFSPSASSMRACCPCLCNRSRATA